MTTASDRYQIFSDECALRGRSAFRVLGCQRNVGMGQAANQARQHHFVNTGHTETYRSRMSDGTAWPRPGVAASRVSAVHPSGEVAPHEHPSFDGDTDPAIRSCRRVWFSRRMHRREYLGSTRGFAVDGVSSMRPIVRPAAFSPNQPFSFSMVTKANMFVLSPHRSPAMQEVEDCIQTPSLLCGTRS